MRHGHTWPRWRSTCKPGPGSATGATTAAIRPSRIARSTMTSPSAETCPPGGRPVRSAAGTVALRSQYAFAPGTVTKPPVTSSLAPDRALVPRAEDQVGQRRQPQEDQDAAARDHEERGEHSWNLHRVAGLEDTVGESRLHAARPRDELRDHRADQRQPAADAEPAQEVGHGARQPQVPEDLPARRAVELEEIQEIVVGAVEPERGVGHDRKERDDPRADQERQRDVLDPDD